MPVIDQLINGLVGAAFGLRAFDDRRPIWARAAYAAVGVDLLRAAYKGEPILTPGSVGDARGRALRTATGDAAPALKFEEVKLRTNDVAERVKYIHKQTVAGTRDPQIYALARAVLSRKCGSEWCVKERDHRGEATALFNEVRSRVRYTLDPTDFDAFASPSKTLALRAGDCDDQVILLAAMLRSVGKHVWSRVYHTKGWPTWNHIALVTQLPDTKEWMPLDPTVDQPAGWEVSRDVMVEPPRDFLVTEKGIPALR